MTFSNKKSGKSILWVSFFQALGLDNASLLNTLIQLSNYGHRVSLITVKSSRTNIFVKKGFETLFIPFRKIPLLLSVFFAVFLWFYLPIFIIKSKIDTVIMEPGVQVLSAFPLLLISKIRKIAFILDIRSTPVETSNFSGTLLRYWFNISVLIAKHEFDAVTIITPLMAKKVCEDFKMENKKIGIWTSGVSLELFNPANFHNTGKQLRIKLNLEEKFVIFYHGAFTRSRGLGETINAIGLLRRRYPDLVLFLLGDGPFKHDLKQMVKTNSLQDNVIIADPVNQLQVPIYISMSDVAIVPLPDNLYWKFQSPLKLLEYLAMEKAVILTRIPAHYAIVQDEKCGFYVSSVDPQEIAQVIEFVYLNKESLYDQGRIGRRLIENRFSWEKVVGDLDRLIISIS